MKRVLLALSLIGLISKSPLKVSSNAKPSWDIIENQDWIRSGILYYSIKCKYFTGTDTESRNFRLSFVKYPASDSMQFILTDIKYHRSYIKIADSLFIFNHSTNSLREYNEPWVRSYGKVLTLLDIPILYGKGMVSSRTNPSAISFVRDTIIQKRRKILYDIASKYPQLNDSATHDSHLSILVNKRDRVPVRSEYTISLRSLTQYRESILNTYSVNGLDARQLIKMAEDSIKVYRNSKVTPRNIVHHEVLATGKQAADISFCLMNDDSTSLSRIKSDYILIDFWYYACYPCMRSIPILNSVQLKYKDHIYVLGLNCIDKDTARVDDAISRFGIQYQVGMGNAKIIDTFKVHGFPTFYLLDKNRQILYSSVGYDANLTQKIDSVMEPRK